MQTNDNLLEFAALRRQGIALIQRLAGEHWSDHNLHDPGITILETLCYALTDLGYRTAFPVPDLVSRGGEDTYADLPGPDRVLTSRAVTRDDLRRLLIDIDGVRNAWIEPVHSQSPALYYDPERLELRLDDAMGGARPVRLRGLNRVLIARDEYVEVSDSTLRARVAQRLHANRNLGEDFDEIKVLPPQDVEIEASIEVGASDSAESVLSGVYQALAGYLSPRVRFHSLGQLEADGLAMDEIFDGPWLDHGFIPLDELRRTPRRTDLRISDLIHAVMDVPGVQAVRRIVARAGGQEGNWYLPLAPDSAPRLSLDIERTRITLEHRGLPLAIDPKGVIADLPGRLRGKSDAAAAAAGVRVPAPPPGRDRDLAHYRSIRHDLPPIYGVGPEGLPDAAGPERMAQASQLAAYLMLFDQVLANGMAQLANCRDLLGFGAEGPRSYFSQPVDDPELDLDRLRLHPEGYAQALQAITEDPDGDWHQGGGDRRPDWGRRNRIANHLLARYAETLPRHAPAGATSGPMVGESLVRDKLALLRNAPRLGAARGTAMDLLRPRGEGNLSGLEQRLRYKLGLSGRGEESFYLVEHILLRPIAQDQGQRVPLLAQVDEPDPYSLRIGLVFPAWPERPGFRTFVERRVREESPAHLVVQVHWLDRQAMAEFAAAYDEWLDQRRAWWLGQIGGGA